MARISNADAGQKLSCLINGKMITMTLEELRQLINYDKDSGIFTRKYYQHDNKIGDPKKRVDPIFFNGTKSYRRVTVLGKRYYAHVLAWFYVTGEWPDSEIDHKDGDGLNNIFLNLRDVTRQVNLQNEIRPRKNNRSGFLGVSIFRNKFKTQIRLPSGERIHLGVFDTAAEAHGVYLEAKRKHQEGCTI